MKSFLLLALLLVALAPGAFSYRYYEAKINFFSRLIGKKDCRFSTPDDPTCFCGKLDKLKEHSPLYFLHSDPAFMMFYHTSQNPKSPSDLNQKLFDFSKKLSFNNVMTNIRELKKLPSQIEPKIPLKLHKIWITNPENPVPIQDSHSIYFGASVKSLLQSSRWEIYLWVNEEEKNMESIRQLQESFPQLIIMNVNKIGLFHKTKALVDQLISERRYVDAAAIYKIYILYEYGGAYADIDMEFILPIDFLHFVAPQYQLNKMSRVDLSFMGAKANSKSLFLLINQIDRLDFVVKNVPKVGQLHPQVADRISILFTANMLSSIVKHPEDLILLIPIELAKFVYHEKEESRGKGLYGNKKEKNLIYCLSPIDGER